MESGLKANDYEFANYLKKQKPDFRVKKDENNLDELRKEYSTQS